MLARVLVCRETATRICAIHAKFTDACSSDSTAQTFQRRSACRKKTSRSPTSDARTSILEKQSAASGKFSRLGGSLLGGDGDDTLNGQGSTDVLAGNDGNDVLSDLTAVINEAFTFTATVLSALEAV